MNNRLVVLIVMGIVLSLGLLIQTARLEFFEQSYRNTPWAELNDNFKTVDSVSPAEMQQLPAEKFLILYDPGNGNSVELATNIARVIKYMKKSGTLCSVYNDNHNYRDFQAVALAFDRLDGYPGISRLVDYVNQGGIGFLAQRPLPGPAFKSLYPKLGIHIYREQAVGDGIQLVSNILIGCKGYRVTQDFFSNYYWVLRLKRSCTVHATFLDRTPMLWEARYGRGKFIVFNGSNLKFSMCRGLIAGIISLTGDDFIYPIYNFKVCFIDDFPTQIPNSYIKNIAKGYGRSYTGFYREIWWPKILQVGKRYNLKYSEAVIETYNDKVKPPFKELFPPALTGLKIYGREILKNGGEIGLHGYNHQPLAEPGYMQEEIAYKPWPSLANMEGAVKEANRYVKTVFPNYRMQFYVPPSNIISPKGREALVKAMPNLKVIASFYDNEGTISDALIQDFGVGKDGVVDLPRITYDYTNSQVNNWTAFNGVASLGVYSHFIHPDDVVDPDRNYGKNWEELATEFELLHKNFYRRYPWLRSMTASQAGAVVRQYEYCEVYLKRSAKGILVRCNKFPGEFYFILRTRKQVLTPQDCPVSKIDQGVFLIHATQPAFFIKLK